MPLPKEHAARLKDPGKYKEIKRQNDKFGPGIHAIFGITDDGKSELQSIHFDKDKFTPAEAKEWLEEHGHTPIEFEPAKTEAKESFKDQFRETWQIRLTEAIDPIEGKEWEVCLIEEGTSLNLINYPAKVLEAARHLFEDVKAYALEFSGEVYDHLPEIVKEANPGGVIKNIVGWFDSVRVEPVPGSGKLGLLARFHIAENAKWLREMMKDAWKEGKKTFLGFSIDAYGRTVETKIDGRTVYETVALERVDSVDVVSNPAAGGQFLRLVASQKQNHKQLKGTEMEKLKEALIRLAEAINEKAFEGKDQTTLTESQIKDVLKQLAEAAEEGTLAEKNLKATLKHILAQIESGISEVAAMQMIEAFLKGEVVATLKETKDPPKKIPEPPKDPPKKVDEQTSLLESDPNKRLNEAEKKYLDSAQKFDELTTKAEERERIAESQSYLVTRLAECKLPDPFKKKLEAQFKGIAFENSKLDKTIEAEEEALAKFTESGQVRGLGEKDIKVGPEKRERWQLAFQGLLANEDLKDKSGNPVPRFTSLHESIREIADVHGEITPNICRLMLGEANLWCPQVTSNSPWADDEKRLFETIRVRRHGLRESLQTSDWAEIMGTSINKQMIKEYILDPLNQWRLIVSDIGNLKNVLAQSRPRLGGYGILETVGEKATYPELTDPGDEEKTYTPAKKGGLASYTWEMLLNDNVRAMANIPKKLGRSANRTLYYNFFNHFTGTISTGLGVEQDGTTELAIAARGNYGTTALGHAGMTAVRTAMRDQAAYGDTYEILGMGNEPRWLLIPNELIPIATQITKDEKVPQSSALYSTGSAVDIAATTTNVHSTYGLDFIVLDYWTDANNWWSIADPKKVPTVEVGFLGGKEEPELFVSDQPNVGSMFTADKIVFKVRHVWGICFLDYRPFYGSKVS